MNPVFFVVGLAVECLIQKHNDDVDVLNIQVGDGEDSTVR